jgi:hypothetical protein
MSIQSHIQQFAKKHKELDDFTLRYTQPRKCKVSDRTDPSLYKNFIARVWLQSKVGNGSTYSLVPRKDTPESIPYADLWVVTLKNDPSSADYIEGEPEISYGSAFNDSVDVDELFGIVFDQKKAVVGTIVIDDALDPTQHMIAFLFRPPIKDSPSYSDQPATFYILSSYAIPKEKIDAIERMLLRDAPEDIGPVKVEQINGNLQGDDPLCVSWSLMMLYYITKIPIEHFIYKKGRPEKVVATLPLNEVTGYYLRKMLEKLKLDVGGLTAESTSEVFPYLYGSGPPSRKRKAEESEPAIIELPIHSTFKHSSKVGYDVFAEKFLESKSIFTYKYDSGKEHYKTSFYIQATKPVKVFNLKTHEGAMEFRKMLMSLPDKTLVSLFDEKVKNIDDFLTGDDPIYASVGKVDNELVDGLVKYRDKFKIDGWKLQLGVNGEDEYLFLNPSQFFVTSKKIPSNAI